MADYSELKAAIRAAIYDNTEQAITGEVLQDILVEMVDELGVPEGGIPASELTQAVRQALEKALSAYQKPATGIPSVDIADGVIPDVSQFITKTVTDLVHYYTKEETYTQQQVNDLIGAISQFHYEIYASLGDITSPASNVLYLIGPTGSGSDQYEEYVYANGAFTKIGDTSIDLSGYLRYTPQTLTEEEKAQARQNIGATSPEVFFAEYGVTTAAEVIAAKDAGKVVGCLYADGFYSLSNITSTLICFAVMYEGTVRFLRINRSTDAWSGGTIQLQGTGQKAQTIAGNETDTSKYPSTKAVADALGKMGVVSQTQTWANDYGSYTISNVVRGLIPQSFIDQWIVLTRTFGGFNAVTGYFELNGLTDLSYEDALEIVKRYSTAPLADTWRPNGGGDIAEYFKARTDIPFLAEQYVSVYLTWNKYIEVSQFRMIVKKSASGWQNGLLSYGNYRLKRMLDYYNITSDLTLNYFYALEECYFILGASLTASHSKFLSLASIVWMVDNAANTAAITITLHATAYARCQADTTEYTYNEQTYTGIIAYATAKNITIASA